MKILAIETSCDETGISVLEVKKTRNSLNFEVLANTLASQIEIHKEYGGVYPALAKREHIKNLPILFTKVLKQLENKNLKLKKPFDLITVTSGPGLEPALWTGIVYAKELSEKYNVPIIPANHMEGHILSVFADTKENFKIPLNDKNLFPMLALLISGGHTELILIKDFGKYKVIGETVDDAVGEAYDKVARMLELPYPGGPEISRLADDQRKFLHLQNIAQADEPSIAIREHADMRVLKMQKLPSNIRAFQGNISSFNFKLPRPMIYTKDFNFSFSGLKTAVLYLIRDLKKENIEIDINMKSKIALEFENAVTETLVHKTKKAIEKYKVRSLIVAGGVSANKNIKKEINKMTKKYGIKTLFPDLKLTGDNSLMIALAGYLKYIKNPEKKYKNIKAEGNLRLK